MLIKNLFKYWTYQVFAPGVVLRENMMPSNPCWLMINALMS
jgi:hypothetical protein